MFEELTGAIAGKVSKYTINGIITSVDNIKMELNITLDMPLYGRREVVANIMTIGPKSFIENNWFVLRLRVIDNQSKKIRVQDTRLRLSDSTKQEILKFISEHPDKVERERLF